jgi:hypothetical protein
VVPALYPPGDITSRLQDDPQPSDGIG